MSQNESPLKPDRDCRSGCRSQDHGESCVEALTKRGVSDRHLASYLYHRCANFARVEDGLGRRSLHIAASCGRVDLCHWLVKSLNAEINARDYESGYTALHRSIYYGHVNVAVRLIQMGADPEVRDNEDMTVSDILCSESDPPAPSPCQPYIWGVNKNYSLGTGSDDTRKMPELIELTKPSVSVIQVAMEELHSVFVTGCGRVWSCGTGQGGRLGSGSHKSLLTPQPIKTPDKCIAAAVGTNHTLLLLENHVVLSFGINQEHQLGVVPHCDPVLSPRPVCSSNFSSTQPITGIAASKYHSVFYNESCVWTCGLNIGQFGRPPDQRILTKPTKASLSLAASRKIVSVSTCPAAIVIALSNGDLYLLHKFQCKKIVTKNLDIVKVVAAGGPSSTGEEHSGHHSETPPPLHVAVLTSRGSIFLWTQDNQLPTRCILGTKRCISIKDLCLVRETLLLVTKDGTAYRGSLVASKRPNTTVSSSTQCEKVVGKSSAQFHKFVDRSECYLVKLKRIPNIFRGLSITSDPKGNNYAVLQTDPRASLTEIPVVSDSNVNSELADLLNEASPDDTVHDAVLVTNGVEFAVHLFVLCERGAKLLAEEAAEAVKKGESLRLSVDPYILELILLYLYTSSSPLLTLGPFNSSKMRSKEDPLKLAGEFCVKWKIQCLTQRLQKLRYEGGSIVLRSGGEGSKEHVSFKRENWSNLYDVKLKSDDGKVLPAHRCILVAKLQYFHSMFLGGWSESSKDCVLPLHYPWRVVNDLIDFIYQDRLPMNLSYDEDLDHIVSLLVAGDELLIGRLKMCCEQLLVCALSLRSAVTILQLAVLYNAPQLKDAALQFISLNLPFFLQSRSLECLPDNLLLELSDYYRKFSKKDTRIITPHFQAPTDAEILSVPLIPWQEEDKDGEEGGSWNLLDEEDKKSNRRNKRSAKKSSGINIQTPQRPVTTTPTNTPPDSSTVAAEMRKNIEESSVKVVAAEVTENVRKPTVSSQESPPMAWVQTDFPLLSITPNRGPATHKPITPNMITRSVGWKEIIPSQRERKRLNLTKSIDVVATSPPTSAPSRTWAALSPPKPQVFQDYMEPDSSDNDQSFLKIMEHDIKKRVNLVKVKTKPFFMNQIEEKALLELKLFYNADDEFDERITVERMPTLEIDEPLWITTGKT